MIMMNELARWTVRVARASRRHRRNWLQPARPAGRASSANIVGRAGALGRVSARRGAARRRCAIAAAALTQWRGFKVIHSCLRRGQERAPCGPCECANERIRTPRGGRIAETNKETGEQGPCAAHLPAGPATQCRTSGPPVRLSSSAEPLESHLASLGRQSANCAIS